MSALVAGMLLVPLADQGLKLLLRRWLGTRSIPLGILGSVRLVQAQIWLTRSWGQRRTGLLWTLLLLNAAALTSVTLAIPSCGGFAGLLLGGAFSHALETTFRGSVCDYVCLRFWAAFNAADAAMTVGAAGLLVSLLS